MNFYFEITNRIVARPGPTEVFWTGEPTNIWSYTF